MLKSPRHRSVLMLVLSLALSTTTAAQWARHVPPGTPVADGKPNLNAPPPRTADGKLDLSGVWENRGGFGRNEKPPTPPPGTPPVAMFWEVGAGLPDGLPYQPAALALKKERMANESRDNPDAHCLPLGFMQLHTHPQPRKIVQTPGVTLIMYEANYGLRQIFTDGRSLPPKDAEPWWYGYSVGRWEGDTFVVDTTGLKDDGWLDVNGSPFTNAAHITERFRRPTLGRLEIDVTVDDPTVYTRPWTVRVNHYLMPDQDLIEFICNENEQSSKHFGK